VESDHSRAAGPGRYRDARAARIARDPAFLQRGKMTETTSAGQAGQAGGALSALDEAQTEAARESTEEGRYIPYSGGSMGWFENAGVLKSELPNNYLYYTVMASDRVRSKQFQRWGERFNRRGPRRRFKTMTGVTLSAGKTQVRGTTRDISRHGIRMQFLSEVRAEKGDLVRIKLHESEKSDRVLLEADARVVWSERIGKIRPVWNIGLTFEDLTPAQNEALEPLLQD
jgi:hypothetical protein